MGEELVASNPADVRCQSGEDDQVSRGHEEDEEYDEEDEGGCYPVPGVGLGLVGPVEGLHAAGASEGANQADVTRG